MDMLRTADVIMKKCSSNTTKNACTDIESCCRNLAVKVLILVRYRASRQAHNPMHL